MKRLYITIIATMCLFWWTSSLAIQVPGPDSEIYNQNITNIIDTNNIENPIREWIYMVINDGEWEQDVKWVLDIGEIETHAEAKSSVLNIIKNIINYALAMVSLVALVYLIYHGFLMVTAAWNDEQFKKGLKWIKYATIALIGIGVSRFVISFVFYIIRLIITWDTGPA